MDGKTYVVTANEGDDKARPWHADRWKTLIIIIAFSIDFVISLICLCEGYGDFEEKMKLKAGRDSDV